MQALRTYLDGRSKAEFAEAIGTSPSYLSQILSGHRRPGFDLIVRIDQASGGAVPPESWFAQKPHAPDQRAAG